ncbi:MAG: carboxylesterase [Cellvibrionaceae bacterium]|nr:carboxylesterase [Cellvibrionaceae bacterium]|tara:strand:+ start:132864 stop:134699 length:1836 start_codon:yes stop_codon:yes gene_type:complete
MKPTHLILGLLALLLSACSSNQEPPRIADQSSVRQTQQGAVIGFSDDHNTHAWLSLPFAKAPIDELRWQAPRPPHAWTETREAIQLGQPCTQFWGIMAGVDGKDGDIVGSEDCLTLNIWAPKAIEASKPLPVMLWIHGGGNTAGTANTYRGSHLASDQNVVYVGINYRLGLFGTFAHQSLRNTSNSAADASGNFAVLDMIAALEWVQTNIAAFGGDPENVTIFGESAGGHNVYSLLTSPLAKDLFHKAIIQSGSTQTSHMEEAEALVSDGAGFAGTSSNEVLAQLLLDDHKIYSKEQLSSFAEKQDDKSLSRYLRSKSPQQLMAHIDSVTAGMFNAPESLADGYVLPKAPLMSLLEDSTQLNSVPTLIGSNRDEMKVFMSQDKNWVENAWGFLPRMKDPEKYQRYASYFSQQWKILAVDEPAERLSQHNPEQVFAYRFDWDNSPSNWLADLPGLLGAGHAVEISFVFGDFEKGLVIPYINTEDNREERMQLSQAMMNYWGHFAHHGYPGTGSAGNQIEWKPWSDKQENLMLLDGGDNGIAMTKLKLSAGVLKQRFLDDPEISSQKERCRLYAQSFLVSFQSRDFWNNDEYLSFGSEGCSDYPPYKLVYGSI